MVKKPAPNGSIVKEKKPIIQGILSKYPSGYHAGIKDVPKDKKSQDELAVELLKWVTSTNTTDLKEFAIMRSFSPYRFKHIADTNEYFKDAYECARIIVGWRMGLGWKNGTIHPNYAKEMLPLYDDDYRQQMQDRVKAIIAEHPSSRAIINVIMPDLSAVTDTDKSQDNQ